MKKSLFFFLLMPILIATAALAYVPVFKGETIEDFNRDLKANHNYFITALNNHAVFQPSKAITNSLMDYVLFLASYSQQRPVALALDYLLKTGGPFGFSDKPADEQEKVFLAGAAQAIMMNQPGLASAEHKSSNDAHQKEIIRLQSLAANGNLEHPYHPTITLPKRAQELQLTQGQRWKSFLTLIADKGVSERQFAATAVNAGKKADWLNDVILSGYLMGVLPDVEGGGPSVRGYLDEAWKNNNQSMETQHNYVQWWFPIHTVGSGDRIAPRTLITTRQTLKDHGDVLSAVQEMLAASFVRKLTFWGQKFDESLKVVSLTPKESQGLGSATYGKNWHENWVTSTHNYPRMDRFLRSLLFFGLKNYANSLYVYLQETAASKLPEHSINCSLNNHWSKAMKSLV